MKFGFSYDTVPSKIYTAMAAARAVVSASEPDTESASLLNVSQAGITVAPESAREMADAIHRLRDDPTQAQLMGARGREWVERYYSKTAVLDEYDRVMKQVADESANVKSE
jgi:colanic acid biosynthesis glycosyl transferase WcaI